MPSISLFCPWSRSDPSTVADVSAVSLVAKVVADEIDKRAHVVGFVNSLPASRHPEERGLHDH